MHTLSFLDVAELTRRRRLNRRFRSYRPQKWRCPESLGSKALSIISPRCIERRPLAVWFQLRVLARRMAKGCAKTARTQRFAAPSTGARPRFALGPRRFRSLRWLILISKPDGSFSYYKQIHVFQDSNYIRITVKWRLGLGIAFPVLIDAHAEMPPAYQRDGKQAGGKIDAIRALSTNIDLAQKEGSEWLKTRSWK